MTRLTLSSLLIAMTVLVCQPVAAQDDLQQARAELQAGRDSIIREELRLTETEAEAFWPLYDEYVAEITLIRDRKSVMVERFLRAYNEGMFSDDFAEWLLDEHFAIKRDWVAVQTRYIPKFRDAMPVQKVARFYQLENKMDAEMDAQLAIAVPLVE